MYRHTKRNEVQLIHVINYINHDLLQVFAPAWLGEEITRMDVAATICIFFGSVLTCAFGSHCEQKFTIDELLGLYLNVGFLIAEGFWLVTVVYLHYTVAYECDKRYPIANDAQDEKNRFNRDSSKSIFYACLAGMYVHPNPNRTVYVAHG